MENAFVVCCRKARAQFARDLDRFISRQASDAAQQGTKVLAVHVFHRKEREAVYFADIVNPADVGVRNLVRDPHLGMEAREQLLIFRGGRRQKFKRDRLPELQIARAIKPRPCRLCRRVQ